MTDGAQEPFGWYVYRLTDGVGALVFQRPIDSPGTQHVTALYSEPRQPAPEVAQPLAPPITESS
jgi:hypothetical protein